MSIKNVKEILIYGYGRSAKIFMANAVKYGFSIRAIHHKKRFFPSLLSTNEVSEARFIEIANTCNLPIVITNIRHKHKNFKKAINHLRNTLHLTNQILHPTFLCDYYKSDQQRYHLRGFPGSGNMVFQTILDQILRSDEFTIKYKPDRLHTLMVEYAFSYWLSLTHELNDLYDSSEITSKITSPKYIKTTSYAISLKDKDPGLPQFDGFPCHAYVWSNPWGGDHSPLTTESIDFFESQRFLNIQLLRHPLDVLISNANKAVCTSQYSVNDILKNDIWFNEILTQITEYYTLIVKNKKKVHVTKYEDLMDNPITTIQHFSTILGSTLPAATCEQIWKSVDGAKLSSYWQPGKNKWKKYLTIRHKEAITASGLINIAQDLGYKINLNQLKDENHSQSNNISDIDLYLIAVRDALDHRSNIGKKITHQHPALVTKRIDGTNIHVNCHQSDFDKINTLIKSDLMRDMINASSNMNQNHSLDAYEYFHKNNN